MNSIVTHKILMMNELIFLVEDAVEGGYIAKALGEGIFTEGETLPELRENIKDAVRCHFSIENLPKIIRLHLVKEEVFSL